MEAPEKINVLLYEEPLSTGYTGSAWVGKPIGLKGETEYIRADAFIEKAAEFLYNYNQKQVLKHGARATLGCGEYTINVDEFRKYMKGE